MPKLLEIYYQALKGSKYLLFS